MSRAATGRGAGRASADSKVGLAAGYRAPGRDAWQAPAAKPLLEHLHDYANLMLANLLWLVSSLPLLTLPAATAGLSAVMASWARGGRPDVPRTFFGAARRQFWRAWLVVLVDLALAAPLLLDLLIIQGAGEPGPLLLVVRGLCLAGLVFLAAVNLWLWPSLESGERLAALWRRAASAVLLRPLATLAVLAASAAVFGLGLLLPRAAFLFISVAAAAFVACWGVSRIERGLPERLAAGAGAELGDHRERGGAGAVEGVR